MKHLPPNTPPDRSHVLTEQRNPRSMNLHTLSVAQCVALINDEDQGVIDAVRAARPAITSFIEALVPRFAQGGRLIYLGAGTSGRLGVLDASECPPTFQLPQGRVVGIIAGGDSALRISSEGKEDDPLGARHELAALKLTQHDTVLGIAAGGSTPYVLGALDLAKGAVMGHVLTGLLSCSPVPKPRSCDHLIVLESGPEVLTGSTRMKAGSATKMALNIISTTLMIQTGRVHENLMVDVKASNDKLRDRAARIISTLTKLPRDQALRLLDDAGGNVKTAIAMHALSWDRAAAEQRLSDLGGRLSRLLQ